MNLHFQNLKDLTMDQIFFCSQKKKPSIFFVCKNKNFERKKEKNKIFSLCSPKFLQCYPVTTPAQFLPRTQRTRITGYTLHRI